MNKIKFTIYGDPVGKGRPRATMINGHARMYTPKKTQSYEAKVILDALNGVAYHDDSQVVELHVIKHYAEEPRVDVLLKERKDYTYMWQE